MHVATQLSRDSFDLEVCGRPASVEDVLPAWTPADRFGIVVDQPLGGVGASMLIQLATVCFYDAAPQRRSSTEGVYPEIYLFHCGGNHGDFSAYDFWPPRKEVTVRAPTPVSLLEQLNMHGISRLALPVGELGIRDVLRKGPSTWAEIHSATTRITSTFIYSPTGEMPDSDVVIRSSDPRAEENVDATLDPVQTARALVSLPEPEFLASLPGPSEPSDVHVWAHRVEHRAQDSSQQARTEARAVRTSLLQRHGGVSTEFYRRVPVDDALLRIAGL